MNNELKARAREIIQQLDALYNSKRPGGGVHGQVIGMEPWTIRTTGDGLQCVYEAQYLLHELLDPFDRKDAPPSPQPVAESVTPELLIKIQASLDIIAGQKAMHRDDYIAVSNTLHNCRDAVLGRGYYGAAALQPVARPAAVMAERQSIDTPEFRELLGDYVRATCELSEAGTVRRARLIAHIDANRPTAMGAGGLSPFEPTQAQFNEWCERHDMRQHLHREAFDDAASLYLTAPRPAASGAVRLPLTDAQERALFDAWVKEDRIPNIQRKHHWKTWLRAIGMMEQDEHIVRRAANGGAGGQKDAAA